MAKKYHYSSYWGTWSRRLSSDHKHGPYVEVNLTPINDCNYASRWEDEVEPIIIRTHCTPSSGRDIDTNILPLRIGEDMVKFLGVELTKMLLDHDFLSEIDDELLRTRMQGGGVPFREVAKEG
jgi:hypothetical protein